MEKLVSDKKRWVLQPQKGNGEAESKFLSRKSQSREVVVM